MNNIDRSQFEYEGKNLKEAQSINRPSMYYFQIVYRRIKKNKPAMFSLWLIIILILMSIILPIIFHKLDEPSSCNINFEEAYQAPIISNQRSMELCKNTVFSYKKSKYNLRKTEITLKEVELKNQKGIITFTIGNKGGGWYQRDKKAYNLEVECNAADDWDGVLKKLNDAANNLLKEEPDFRGIIFKKSGSTLYIESVGEKSFNSEHWFGTDQFGRDLFIRLWKGGRTSFLIAFVAAFITIIFGSIYGGISGYVGGRVDSIMMRIIEMLSIVPDLLYIILLMEIFVMKLGFKSIVIVLAASSWMGIARLVRGEVLGIKASEYVVAAKILGASSPRIIFKHLIPNAMGPIIVNMIILIPHMIFLEVFLSFLGLGVPLYEVSWGNLMCMGSREFYQYPHLLLFPSIVLSLTMIAFNIFGDELRDVCQRDVSIGTSELIHFNI